MKQFSQQLHKKATTAVKLQAAERRELRERLVAYMEYHPLPAEMQAKKPTVTAGLVATEPFALVKVPFHAFFKYGAIAAAVVLVIVPFMAERAVPGDALYAIKVQFNEEVRSTLTFDGYQKVAWETERLNRRIAEARLLASEGRLTEEVEAEVAAAVREHTESAKREIEALRAEDADEAEIASIALDTTLEVQSTSLKGEESEAGVAAAVRPVSLIATAIDESRDPVDTLLSTSTVPAYDKLMARVELNTTRIYELRDSLQEVVTAEELVEVNRRIADLERAVQEAIDAAVSDETAARRLLVEVLQRTQRLIVFMTELEVTETVDIETIVPVVLTDEEEQAHMARVLSKLAVEVKEIDTLLPEVADADLLEKVQKGRMMVLEMNTELSSMTDFAAFQTLAAEAEATAADTIILLKQYYDAQGINLPIVEIETASSTDPVATSTEPVLPEGTEATTTTAATGSVEVLPEEAGTGTESTNVDSEAQ